VLRAARRQRCRQRLQAGAFIADHDLQRRDTEHIAIRGQDDLRRIALEARREVIGASRKRRDDDDRKDGEGREAAGFLRIESIHG
jgi:hypothetical protein